MKRIIIDCDPGIDDALAIMMAYMNPEVKIEAITSVSGNVDVERTTANVLKILDVLDAEVIPVYAGCSTALVEEGEHASFVHGEDGLGGVAVPVSSRQVLDEPAALALIRLAKENPEELELIAIGPLTNLALALRLYPDLPSLYKRLVIMGGAHFAKGNTRNPPAEFNIFADPEAAAVVFDNWKGLTMVSWEATLAHGLPIEDIEPLFDFKNQRSAFLKQIMSVTFDYTRDVMNSSISYAADPLAMAVLIEPEIILESETKHVQIERSGQLSRGMTVVDWWGMSQKDPNVTIVTKVDLQRYFALLKKAFE